MSCVLKCYVLSHSSRFKWSLMVIWTHTWGVLSTQYTEELEKCMGSIVPSETVEKFNYEGLCKAIEQLSDFEEKVDTTTKIVYGVTIYGVTFKIMTP